MELEQEPVDYTVTMLNNIRETIETMSKFNQIEVLRILYGHKDVIINENKYGIHINLTDLDNSVLSELQIYIDYVTTQEIQLNEAEKQKEDYKNIYFNVLNLNNKDIKENISIKHKKYV